MNAAQARALTDEHSDQTVLHQYLRTHVFPMIAAAARRGEWRTPFVCESLEIASFTRNHLRLMGYKVLPWSGSKTPEDTRKEMVISW